MKRKVFMKLVLSILFVMIAVTMGRENTYADEYQPAMWFMDDLNITQEPGGNYSHAGTQNFDVVGVNNRNIKAPFDCEIVAIFNSYNSGNTVIIQSCNPVRYANGNVGFMSMAFAHDNDISDCYVGRRIMQGEIFYQNGDYGYVTGVHSHVTCMEGKYTDHPGWVTVSTGNSTFHNGMNPKECLFISSNTNIYDSKSLNFVTYISETTKPTVEEFKVAELREGAFTVMARCTDASGIKSVQYAIWTNNGGQDDLVWHNASCTDGNGVYWSRINFSDHKNERGTYIIHAYVYDNAGNLTVQELVYTFDSVGPVISDVKVTDLSESGYTISCKVQDESMDVTKVRFPTWTLKNDQDDLASNWETSTAVEGTRDGDVFIFRVNTSEHNNEVGTYITHIYAYDTLGNVTRVTNFEYPDLLVSIDININPPQKDSDGWYYCEALPLGINKDNYTIQYNNYYEKVQSNSPGSDWNNAGVVRNEWQNTGSTYTSPTDLPTSDARILVRSCYYHFCGPNSGAEANYEIAGVFTHYDSVDASQVTGQYLGDDNGHPYYFIYWPDGNQVYCSSGVTCDGSYGSHGARSRAWYKENTYQDRVNIVIYKFKKESGWVDSVSSDASSYGIRFKEKDCSVSGEHTYETVVVAANATTKTKGTITKQCTVCGDIAAQKAVNYPKNIILSESEFIYDGKVKSPTVTITDSAGKTIDSKHYDIVMSPGRKNVGRYDCTVNFKGKYYTGSINTTFTIVPKATGISGLSNASDGIIIKWKTNSQATGYKIYKSADGKNYKRIAIIKGKDTVSYVDKDQLINGEKYYYKICAYKNDSGVAITSADSSIKAIYRLDRTILATVTPVVGKLSVQWETNSKATGYEIQYSLDSKFTTVIDTVVMTKGTSYRKTILDLVSGQRYYVRVRAYKEVSGKTYYSAWSSPKNAVVR